MSSLNHPLGPLAPANDMSLVLGPKASVIGCLALPGEAILPGPLEAQIKADGVLVSRGETILETVIATEVIHGEVLDALIVQTPSSCVMDRLSQVRSDGPRSLAPSPPPSSQIEAPFDGETRDVIARA